MAPAFLVSVLPSMLIAEYRNKTQLLVASLG
jgi:hypothetical protein